MKYSTTNLLVSLQRDFAEALKTFGYNVRWHATKEVEATASLAPKGTVTLVPEFPVDPAFMVRLAGLNDGTTQKDEEIAVPAFALQLPSAPVKIRRVGIGHSDFERQRVFNIHGFAYDEFQQRELMDFLSDWLDSGDVMLPVWDYDTDPNAPVALDPVQVERAAVDKDEEIHEVEAVRYFLCVAAAVSYFE